ncbi:MAG: hypothetical protein QMD50_01920 [Patescibacteria group bacterium]|nr:hypothetical protein [Patescibacteria group bacterium]
MMTASEKIAKILRADKDFIRKIEMRFSLITGKTGIMEKIIAENNRLVLDRLADLGVARGSSAKEVYDALISKIESDDNRFFEVFKRPNCNKQKDCEGVLETVKEIAKANHGFFLKKEKAIEFLNNIPPQKVMSYLGHKSVSELLKKEDLFEVYSALRFIEGNDWLNNVFFKQYETLKPIDFEERGMIVKALSEKWSVAAEGFVQKKWHNISHLKELGVVFVIPISLGISGELLRMLSLVFHYLHEIPFYSDMFKKISEVPETFASNFVSLLRGDVIDRRMSEGEKSLWLVVQRYLAKDDENEWRLFVPHINPEALHWLKAEEDLIKAGSTLNHFGKELEFWHDLDWVGDFFKDEIGNDVLVSFNLVDTVMSLVMEKELVKYLYHHEEALWNKVFIEYFSRAELEKFSKEYLLQGYFEI